MKPRKPLVRTPIKQGLGRIGKMKAECAKVDRSYWLHFKGLCQFCRGALDENSIHIHHKKKRSLGGSEVRENKVALHGLCHTHIHSIPSLVDAVRNSKADLINGDFI